MKRSIGCVELLIFTYKLSDMFHVYLHGMHAAPRAAPLSTYHLLATALLGGALALHDKGCAPSLTPPHNSRKTPPPKRKPHPRLLPGVSRAAGPAPVLRGGMYVCI